MAKTSITLTHERASDYRGSSTDPARLVVAKFSTLLAGAAGGVYPGCTTLAVDTGPASGTVTLAGGADDVVVTVGGFSIAAVPAGADDTATAADVAAAIIALAGLTDIVTATSSGAVVTITSKVNGAAGNFALDSETLAAGTATASGATLTGGVTSTYTF